MKVKPDNFDDMVQFARNRARWMCDNSVEILGLKVCLFAPDGGNQLSRDAVKQVLLVDEEHLNAVVDYARQGWGLADSVIREMITGFVDSGAPMPESLADYQRENVLSPKKRPAGEPDTFLRDMGIAILVMRLCDKFNVVPTGRDKTYSACHAVAEAMLKEAKIPVSASAVEAIWGQHGHIFGPT